MARAPRNKPRVVIKKKKKTPWVQPRKLPTPLKVEPLPVIPLPWTPAQLDAIVEEICRFIQQAKRRHGIKLGWEVGEYIFLNMYAGDVSQACDPNPAKKASTRKIALASGIPKSTLQAYVDVAVVRRLLAERGVHPDLTLTHLQRIARLRDHMDAMVALVTWVEAEKIGSQRLPAIVKYWKDHLDRGGSLADLVKRPLPRPVPRKKHRRGGARPDPDDLVLERLVLMLREWVLITPLSSRQKAVLRRQVMSIRAALVGAEP